MDYIDDVFSTEVFKTYTFVNFKEDMNDARTSVKIAMENLSIVNDIYSKLSFNSFSTESIYNTSYSTEGLGNSLKTAWEAVKKFFKMIADAIIKFLRAIGNFFKKLWNAVTGNKNNAVSAIKNLPTSDIVKVVDKLNSKIEKEDNKEYTNLDDITAENSISALIVEYESKCLDIGNDIIKESSEVDSCIAKSKSLAEDYEKRINSIKPNYVKIVTIYGGMSHVSVNPNYTVKKDDKKRHAKIKDASDIFEYVNGFVKLIDDRKKKVDIASKVASDAENISKKQSGDSTNVENIKDKSKANIFISIKTAASKNIANVVKHINSGITSMIHDCQYGKNQLIAVTYTCNGKTINTDTSTALDMLNKKY